MSQQSITDSSRPNAGRIYDYILGGSHNFEVDRLAAGKLLQLAPFMTKVMRLQRWCLQDLAAEFSQKRGFDFIIDFASGLPTNDHIHHVVPKGTTVIYSDWDPVVVEYAHEILAGTPNVHYFQADARRPEELLNRPEVQEILGGRRDVGIVYWGVSAFLADEDIIHAAKVLYEWAGKNSVWAILLQGSSMDVNNPMVERVTKIYEQMGSPLYSRTTDRYLEMLRPWKPDAKGLVGLLEWHGLNASEMSPEDQRSFGPSVAHGTYLIKE